MVDRMTVEQRSRAMAAVHGRGNASTELRLAKLFRKHRIKGWKRHASILGKPDFVFEKRKIAVFVDGCFWHGCKKHRSIPETNRKFWLEKLKGNGARDRFVNRSLRSKGWKVIRIWEHEVKGESAKLPKKLAYKALMRH